MDVQEDKLMALENLVGVLGGKDSEFANSLISQGSKRVLSEKQMYWVDLLVKKGLGVEPAAEVVKVGGMSGLLSLFNKAKEKLKYPKLHLSVKGRPVVVSLAGPKSKAPGTINVAGEGDFNQRPWYGRVDTEGNWTKGFKKYEESGEIELLLNSLSQNPAKAAKEYGVLTGCCVFCNSKLTDEKSTAAGFGPVCAKNWNLTKEWKHAVALLEKELSMDNIDPS